MERGHEIVVLTGMPNYPAGHLFPGYRWSGPWSENLHGVRVLRVPLVTRGLKHGLRLALNYLSFALCACLIGPLRCRGQFDAVIVYEPSPITVGLPGLLMARLSGAPALLWVQDLWPDTLEAMGFRKAGFALRIAATLSDFVHRRCDRLLLQSRGFIHRIEARVAATARMRYLPNWAESFYQPLPPQPDAPAGIDTIKGFKVVFAGNIGASQSFATIVEAARKLRDVVDLRWIIFGDGNMREWLEGEIVRLGLDEQVLLLGQRPAEDMPSCFSHADALLVTLRADPVFALTIPSKLQSYLACGRPVVAALDGEGAVVVRESGAGVCCPAGDAAALAEAVLEIYRMPLDERRACGKRARAYYEKNFDRNLLLDRLDGWLREYDGNKPCAS